MQSSFELNLERHFRNSFKGSIHWEPSATEPLEDKQNVNYVVIPINKNEALHFNCTWGGWCLPSIVIFCGSVKVIQNRTVWKCFTVGLCLKFNNQQHVEISLNSLPGRGVMDTFFTQAIMPMLKKEKNKGVQEPKCFTEKKFKVIVNHQEKFKFLLCFGKQIKAVAPAEVLGNRTKSFSKDTA